MRSGVCAAIVLACAWPDVGGADRLPDDTGGHAGTLPTGESHARTALAPIDASGTGAATGESTAPAPPDWLYRPLRGPAGSDSTTAALVLKLPIAFEHASVLEEGRVHTCRRVIDAPDYCVARGLRAGRLQLVLQRGGQDRWMPLVLESGETRIDAWSDAHSPWMITSALAALGLGAWSFRLSGWHLEGDLRTAGMGAGVALATIGGTLATIWLVQALAGPQWSLTRIEENDAERHGFPSADATTAPADWLRDSP